MERSEHFDVSREALDWAAEAIKELDGICTAFFGDRGNCGEVIEIDADAGQKIIKVASLKPIPRSVVRKSTEALQRIRHAFDQTLYGACCAIGMKPRASLYFPWSQNPTDLEHRLGALRPEGKRAGTSKIPPELWPILRKTEPYGTGDGYSGGDDFVRAMAQIANQKHTVHLLVKFFCSGVNYKSFKSNGPSSIGFPDWDPIKNEIVIAKVALYADAEYEYAVQGGIILSDPGPLFGVPVEDALARFLGKAQGILEAIEREAIRIGRV